MKHAQHLDYRPDVDGLRAVAVLAVVLFHAFPRWLPGGFIGVDIFFVISGFLITGIILRSLREDRFSYLDFYDRRVRRIFPALLTVLLATLVAGYFVLLPEELRALGKQTTAGALFSANLLFWSEAGYFDAASQTKPLLHLWSLGVEEQFYLVWPLLLAFLHRRGIRPFGAVLAIIAASFALNVWWTTSLSDARINAAFYSPFTRFWELGCGALLACLAQARGRDAPPEGVRWRTELQACLGAVLLLAALLVLRESRPFPGWWALLPVTGAMLLIASPHAVINRQILSNRVLVFIGLISYPLYLWHWVVLALWRVDVQSDNGTLGRIERVFAVLLSVLLAWLTYVLVEKRLRFGGVTPLKPVSLGAAMAALAACGIALHFGSAGVSRFPPQLQHLARQNYDDARLASEAGYRTRHCFIEDDQHFKDVTRECWGSSDTRRPLVVLWGDSHAASLVPGLLAEERQRYDFRLAQFTAVACPPLIDVELYNRHNCKDFNAHVLQEIGTLRPDTVLLAGNWYFYRRGGGDWRKMELPDLTRTINMLESLGVRRVVVIGSLPYWNTLQPRVVLQVYRATAQLAQRDRTHFVAATRAVDAEIGMTAVGAGATFVSPLESLCDEAGCLLSTDGLGFTPVTWDQEHLSAAGSMLFIHTTINRIMGSPS